MNTRLQVEHPVTELVTGFDLVREQFQVATGQALSLSQEDVAWRGHAIECRVYAEDAENNFFPSPGTITYLQEPSGPGVRLDSGVRLHSEVSIHYDSMIAKLAVWGSTRDEAIDRLKRALGEYQVTGITTTLPFFRQVVEDDEFRSGRLDTGFISRFNQRHEQTAASVPNNKETDMAIIAAALEYLKVQRRGSSQTIATTSNRWKMSGRNAALNAGLGKTVSSKWRKQ